VSTLHAAAGGAARLAVALTLAACWLAGPAEAAVPPLVFGLNDVPRFQPDPQRAIDLHVGSGATSQRVNAPWRVVQPQPGVWDWGYVDLVYNAAVERGMRPIATVAEVPAWAQSQTFVAACVVDADRPNCQRPPDASKLGDFAAFVRELAARYPRLAAIEVFNEPNLGSFNWQPAADPEYYAQVLRVAHDAAQDVRPALPVISGGVGPPPFPAPIGSVRPEEFLARMYAAGARGAMDGIGLHPYPGRSAPGAEGNSSDALMAAARAIRADAGDAGTPLWVTETGYTTTGPIAVSSSQQARWLPIMVGRLLRQRDVRAVVVHTLADRDDTAGTGAGYGVATTDLAPKSVYYRLAATVRRVARERAAQRRRLAALKKRAAKRAAERRQGARRRG
jgi:hypothetical protein